MVAGETGELASTTDELHRSLPNAITIGENERFGYRKR